MLPLSKILCRLLFNFNAIALALLAFQNAGYIVLMGYAHRLQDAPLADGESSRKKFASSHFLATAELVKLVFCALWCLLEALRAMQREEREAAAQTLLHVEHEELHADRTYALSVDSRELEATQVLRDNVAHLAVSQRSTPSTKNKAVAFSVIPPKPSVRYGDSSLARLIARPNFFSQFATRMRHAVGFDGKYKEALLMIVPAVLYTIQGLLLILALQYLDPTVFQILYQVRIMFLAVMMRVVLDFQLSPVRWAALMGLMVGIILAQLAIQGSSKAGKGEADAKAKPASSWSVEGTLAALAGAFLSSLSGVFMEYVYKKRGNLFHLSARSLHLAFFSLVYFWFGFMRDVYTSPSDTLAETSALSEFFATFFDGFTGLVWFLVVLQATGGILVGLVVRYCDNIVKSFSTAFAIVLSGTASVFLFSLPLQPMFLLGSILVMSSITVYSLKK